MKDKLADLAERFKVPCDCCLAGYSPLQPMTSCLRCQGSGVRYPFRLVCPQQGNHQYMRGMPEGGKEQDGAICADCLVPVFNPDPDVFTDAIADKGWRAVHSIKSPYHTVEIYKPDGGSSTGSILIGMVDSDDGLRGQAALQTALWQTLPDREGE